MSDRQKVAVVTGASSGIGKEVAKALVGAGWRVIATGRDPARMASAEAEIAAAAEGGSVEMLRADLSLIAEADRLAQDVAARTDRLDLLVNNAGGMTDRLEMTGEGLEANFAGNHLGPFALTQGLEPLLRAAAADAPAGATRIVMTASDASEMGLPVDFADMQNLTRFNPGLAYCTGKLANVLFARALASRLDGSGIVAHAMAPGATDTPFFDNAPAETRVHTEKLAKLTVAEGADTLIWLALGDEAGRSSGGYWEKRAPRAPHPQVDDAEAVARFWQESEKLVDGVRG
ncbi:SDR family NAD(P)-dependent oxidoreductase [Novosphingobium sp. JCM 18896]|uniref:SDR family NAD(P)-dependent oxidoreductase n=1 Tax=Novosphingobium sp. JCM 18896 TaxID=2989731 RepID=UPI0022218E89|nr:SDR family NAD(P)-dependent oxidoreductase [Novosphingobium sp. JCM 18896]MCW1429040.1 SDR family NAD(P)-dependent oxidoreductase [Novosphingobium sp. JCM 18896]